MRKTANWDTDIGLNFTLSEFEVNNMIFCQHLLSNVKIKQQIFATNAFDKRHQSKNKYDN